MLTTLIADAAKRVQKMRPEELVARHRFADPVGPELAEWFLRAGWRTVDTSDPAYVASRLMTATLERALEILANDVTECDGDHCYPLDEPYRFRVSYLSHTLAAFATEPDPLVLLDGTDGLMVAGLPWSEVEAGCRCPAIMAAWRAVTAAITEAHPGQVKTQRVLAERQARR